MCYLLLKIGWSNLQVPSEVWPLIDRTAGAWKDVSSATLKQFF